jgi:hypothetical protein
MHSIAGHHVSQCKISLTGSISRQPTPSSANICVPTRNTERRSQGWSHRAARNGGRGEEAEPEETLSSAQVDKYRDACNVGGATRS